MYQPDLSPQSSVPMRDEEDHEERSVDLMNQMGIDSHMFDTLTLQTCPTGNLVIEAGPSDAVVDVSLVLPTYNEGKDIAAVIEQLMPVLDSVEGMEYEVIVVDDDSPDRTWEIALGLTERYPQLRVVRREGERGLSTAVIRGWQIARGKILAVMDADLQHPPEVAAKLSAKCCAERIWESRAVTSKVGVSATGLWDAELFRAELSSLASVCCPK